MMYRNPATSGEDDDSTIFSIATITQDPQISKLTSNNEDSYFLFERTVTNSFSFWIQFYDQ